MDKKKNDSLNQKCVNNPCGEWTSSYPQPQKNASKVFADKVVWERSFGVKSYLSFDSQPHQGAQPYRQPLLLPGPSLWLLSNAETTKYQGISLTPYLGGTFSVEAD